MLCSPFSALSLATFSHYLMCFYIYNTFLWFRYFYAIQSTFIFAVNTILGFPYLSSKIYLVTNQNYLPLSSTLLVKHLTFVDF